MSLQSAEPLAQFSPEEIKEFQVIYAARANLQLEGKTRYDALDEEAQKKYIKWKDIQDHEQLLQGGAEPIIKSPFRRSSQIPVEMLKQLAADNTAVTDNIAPPEESKKKKGCCAIL